MSENLNGIEIIYEENIKQKKEMNQKCRWIKKYPKIQTYGHNA